MGKELDEYIASHRIGNDQGDGQNQNQDQDQNQNQTVDGTGADNQQNQQDGGQGDNNEPEVTFDDEQLNKFFETEGKTSEDIKSIFTLGGKYSDIEKELNEVRVELESSKEREAELRKGLDPMSYFTSEQNYIAEQLRKKYPDMDPLSIQKAVTTDLTKMDDLDVLALKDVIETPGYSGGEAMAKKILADDFGVDLSEPSEQWDELARAKIERAAIKARKELSQFKTEVEIPSVRNEEDLKAERAQKLEDLKTKWRPAISQLSTGFDKITVPGEEPGQVRYEFVVPQSFRDGLPQYFEDIITNGELDPGDEVVADLIVERNKEFIYQNLGKILEAFEKDIRSGVQKQTDQNLNNNEPPNTSTKPDEGTVVSGTEEYIRRQPGRSRR